MTVGYGWSTPGLPHRGWDCEYVTDLEEPEGECEMCGKIGVRYIHHMVHEDYPLEVEAGCVCASKMELDASAAARRERAARAWTRRHARWMSRPWKTSAKGNPYLSHRGRRYVILESKWHEDEWGCFVDGMRPRRWFGSLEACKSDVFETLDPRPVRRWDQLAFLEANRS